MEMVIEKKLNIREMQSKTMSYHLTPVRVAIIKKKRRRKATSVGQGVEALHPVDGNI